MLESCLGVSIVICCHNSATRLPETLRHLAAQQVDTNTPWEVIVVDNGSSDLTAEVAISYWNTHGAPAPLRVVTEPTLGLSHARAKGLAESRFEYVSLIDDDNWVCPDWVRTASDVFTTRPSVGICCGRSDPVFEHEPPSWFSKYQRNYAVGDPAPSPGFVEPELLWGAGLCVRKSVWTALRNAGFSPILSDRRGALLTCGGDTELCLVASFANWTAWYEPRLSFKHWIPKNRLSSAYLRGLYRGFGAAAVGIYFYQLASQPTPSNLRERFRRTWLWHVQNALRHLLHHSFVSLGNSQPEMAQSLQVEFHRSRLITLVRFWRVYNTRRKGIQQLYRSLRSSAG